MEVLLAELGRIPGRVGSSVPVSLISGMALGTDFDPGWPSG